MRAPRFLAAMRALAPILLCLTAGACCRDPWQAFPEATPPDRSCSTGEVHGYDVYSWSCLRGEHVVVAQYSSEMMCRAPVRETSPCGTLTPLEREFRLTPAMCSGPRGGRAWR